MSQEIKIKVIKNPTTFKNGSFITIPSPAEFGKVEEATLLETFSFRFCSYLPLQFIFPFEAVAIPAKQQQKMKSLGGQNINI